MRAYHPTFNVTFIKLCIKVSRVFTFPPKFTTREREKTNQSRLFTRKTRGQRREIESRVVESAFRERERECVCVW